LQDNFYAEILKVLPEWGPQRLGWGKQTIFYVYVSVYQNKAPRISKVTIND